MEINVILSKQTKNGRFFQNMFFSLLSCFILLQPFYARYNHAWRTEQTMPKLPFLRIVTVYRYSILQINLVLGEKGRPTNQWLCSRPWKTSQKKSEPHPKSRAFSLSLSLPSARKLSYPDNYKPISVFSRYNVLSSVVCTTRLQLPRTVWERLKRVHINR